MAVNCVREDTDLCASKYIKQSYVWQGWEWVGHYVSGRNFKAPENLIKCYGLFLCNFK